MNWVLTPAELHFRVKEKKLTNAQHMWKLFPPPGDIMKLVKKMKTGKAVTKPKAQHRWVFYTYHTFSLYFF